MSEAGSLKRATKHCDFLLSDECFNIQLSRGPNTYGNAKTSLLSERATTEGVLEGNVAPRLIKSSLFSILFKVLYFTGGFDLHSRSVMVFLCLLSPRLHCTKKERKADHLFLKKTGHLFRNKKL